MYLWPHIVGRFGKLGVCQSAQIGTILEFFNNFLYKIQIDISYISRKNCQIMYLVPKFGGQMGVSANGPKLDQLNFFLNNFLYKIKIEKGSILFKKKVCVLA